MTIIVTGAAGSFIGSNIVKALNQRGITDIIAVDNLSKGENSKTLPSAKSPIISTNTNLSAREHILPYQNIEAVFHQGACSDTMNHDGLQVMKTTTSTRWIC